MSISQPSPVSPSMSIVRVQTAINIKTVWRMNFYMFIQTCPRWASPHPPLSQGSVAPSFPERLSLCIRAREWIKIFATSTCCCDVESLKEFDGASWRECKVCLLRGKWQEKPTFTALFILKLVDFWRQGGNFRPAAIYCRHQRVLLIHLNKTY